jgi:hypothetical protein
MLEDMIGFRGMALLGDVSEFEGWHLRSEELGALMATDGHLAAGDPSTDLESESMLTLLSVAVPPGRYPFRLTLARRGRGTDERVAAAVLRLQRGRPRWWRPVTVGSAEGGPEVDDVVAIDSAHAFLGSLSAARASVGRNLSAIARRHATGKSYSWGEVDFDDLGNLFFFSSGNGDGAYPILVASDDSDRPAAIVLDFLLLGRSRTKEGVFARLLPRFGA